MNENSTKDPTRADQGGLFDNWIDASRRACAAECAISSRRCWKRSFRKRLLVRAAAGVKLTMQAMVRASGVRNGLRQRSLTGTFGKTRIAVPRARLTEASASGAARCCGLIDGAPRRPTR